MILERDNWTDKSVDFVITDIVEYDMKRAGLSIIRQKKLLDEATINSLALLDKRAADKKIGVMQINNKKLRGDLKEAFKEYRLKFGVANQLSDDDILSVKKDAIFVKKYCYTTQFDDYITFVEKNVYNIFMRIPNSNIELYWKYNGLDVKGISNDNLPLFEDIIKFLYRFMELLAQYDDDGAKKYLIKTIDDYKFRRLPIGFYREFNHEASYSMIMSNQVVKLNEIGEPYKTDVLIEYNFLNVLIPLLGFINV